MIIYKNSKGYETRSDIPNSNWTEKDVYVVDDGSDIAKKVIQNYPYFKFVLDEIGELIDITPTERPPEPTPEPTEIEYLSNYLLDVDMRLVMMELGL